MKMTGGGLNFGKKISTRKWLEEDKLFRMLVEVAFKKPFPVYLVGGYLRDRLLDKPSLDIDVIIRGGIEEIAQEFSKVAGGKFFYLDKEEGIGRVTVREGKILRTVDFSPFKDLRKDLLGRDFTVNALALDLKILTRKEEINSEADIIDFSTGLEDLKEKKIKMISSQSLERDPLRLLRGVRLGGELGFEIEGKTYQTIKEKALLLSKVSSERVVDELSLIFSLSFSSSSVEKLASLGLIDVVFPELASLRGVEQVGRSAFSDKEIGYHHLDAFEHSLFTLTKLEEVLANLDTYYPSFNKQIVAHLSRALDGKFKRGAALKFGALLHDLGKEKTKTVDEEGKVHFYNHSKVGEEIFNSVKRRLKVSRKVADYLSKLIREHMRPGYLESEVRKTGVLGRKVVGKLSQRAILRFFRDCEEDTVDVLLLSMADRLAAQGPWSTPQKIKEHKEFTQILMQAYFAEKRKEEKPPLVKGGELIEKFGLKPGPLIGEILKKIEEAYYEGKVNTKGEALDLAKKLLGIS